jgi:hypothetical protein
MSFWTGNGLGRQPSRLAFRMRRYVSNCGNADNKQQQCMMQIQTHGFGNAVHDGILNGPATELLKFFGDEFEHAIYLLLKIFVGELRM